MPEAGWCGRGVDCEGSWSEGYRGGGDKEKAKIVRDLGADEVVRYNLPRWEGRVKELTEAGRAWVWFMKRWARWRVA